MELVFTVVGIDKFLYFVGEFSRKGLTKSTQRKNTLSYIKFYVTWCSKFHFKLKLITVKEGRYSGFENYGCDLIYVINLM